MTSARQRARYFKVIPVATRLIERVRARLEREEAFTAETRKAKAEALEHLALIEEGLSGGIRLALAVVDALAIPGDLVLRPHLLDVGDASPPDPKEDRVAFLHQRYARNSIQGFVEHVLRHLVDPHSLMLAQVRAAHAAAHRRTKRAH